MRALFRDLGARSALAYLADRLLSKVTLGLVRVRRYLFFVQPLGMSNLRIPQNMRVDSLPADFESLPLPVPADVIRKRLAHGAKCFVLQIGAEFAGYAWFQADRYEEDEVRCTFLPRPECVVWDYDIYIVPKYRATRAFAVLWALAGKQLREAGFTHSASRIAGYNMISIRSHRRLGAKEVGSALFVNAGNLQCMLYGGSVSVTKTTAPSIRLDCSTVA